MDSQAIREMEHKKILRTFPNVREYLEDEETLLAFSHRKPDYAAGISIGFIGLFASLESLECFWNRMPMWGVSSLLCGLGLLALAYRCVVITGKEFAFVTDSRFVYVSRDLIGRKNKIIRIMQSEIVSAKLMRDVSLTRGTTSGQIILKTKKKRWLFDSLADAVSVFYELNNCGHGREDVPFFQP